MTLFNRSPDNAGLPIASLPSLSSNAPVALFDSGVGGITVLEAILRRYSQASTYYIADQAHVPYGGRPLNQIYNFASHLTAHAFEAGAKMVVMACNVSSATYGRAAAKHYGADRVFGVVDPGAQQAAETTKTGRVGILATKGTVLSEAYPKALKQLDPKIDAIQVACPRFVPLIEAGKLSGVETEKVIQEALDPLLQFQVDTVILGCTHYPYLADVIHRLAPTLTLVDPAEATADAVAHHLRDSPSDQGCHPSHTFLTTGDLSTFKAQTKQFLSEKIEMTSMGVLTWVPTDTSGSSKLALEPNRCECGSSVGTTQS